MAINIEGAIRGDDPRIPKAGSLNGVTVLGFLNGKVVSIDATLMDIIDITTKHLPYIGEDYYVYVWNKESQEYVKTEIYVKGDKGDAGPSNTLSIGTVAGGINASASITGIAPNQTLNLVLPKGDTGSNIELQKTATHVQWRVVGGSWSNLIALSDLKGDTGANIELQKTTTHVQWRVVGGSWANLIPLTELKGLKGDAGENAVMTIGTITTVASNAQSNATVEADGLDGQGRPKFKLNLWLPRGADGEGSGDMLKSEYDKNGNGIVDNAEKVGGFTVGTNVPANAKFTDTVYTHPAGTNPHGTTKADVGLGNVDNTSDADKPVSTAQQTAISTAIDAIEIGGRNLVIKTGSLQGYYLDGVWNPTNIALTPKDFIKVVPGGTYTMSIPISEYIDNVVRMAMWDENKDFVVRVNYGGGNQSQPIRIHTITIPNNVHYVTPGYGRDIDIKLEKGNKATDWTPAPEDQAAAIALKIDASKFQVVAELPASPAAGVFYFVKE